jgi:hypothetical protein
MGDLEIRESGGSRDGLFPTLPAFPIQEIGMGKAGKEEKSGGGRDLIS